jgi:hypothetical protein
MRPRQVGLVVLIEGEHPHHATTDLVLVTEDACRQRNGAHIGRIEVALLHRIQPFGTLEQERLDVLELLVENRDVAFGPGIDRLLCHDAVVGDRHHQVAAETGRPVQQQDSGPALDRVTGREGQHRFLVRLVQRDVHEPDALAEQAVRVDDAAHRPDLIGGQRGQRVIRCRGGVWSTLQWLRCSSDALLVDRRVRDELVRPARRSAAARRRPRTCRPAARRARRPWWRAADEQCRDGGHHEQTARPTKPGRARRACQVPVSTCWAGKYTTTAT